MGAVPRLCLVADRPTLGAAHILTALGEVLAAVGEPVLVIDRDDGRDDGRDAGRDDGRDGRGGLRGGGDTRERLAHLGRLRSLCDRAAAVLVVSARVDLALASGADGVHLPERGLPADAVRRAFPGLLVGRSCHDRAGLLRAEADGADYALLSPIAAPHSKPLSGVALGVDGFGAAVQGLSLPVLALGGLTPALAPALRAAGAAGMAALGGILGAPDPATEARRWLAAWDGLGPREPGAS